jgi:hypothetical protein
MPGAPIPIRSAEDVMKALLVYPAHIPQTYWSFSGALPYIERRYALPPLSLVTVAATGSSRRTA